MSYRMSNGHSLWLAFLLALMISGCDSRPKSAVEKDCSNDTNYDRCTSDIAYYVQNYASLHDNFWLSDNADWVQVELLKRFQSYSANTGRWIGNETAVRNAVSNHPFHPNGVAETNTFDPLFVEEPASSYLLDKYFIVDGAIYSTSSMFNGYEEKALYFLVTEARIEILGVERWEFGASDLEALEFCDIDSYQYFLKPEYSQFACEGEFVFSFTLNDFGWLDITLEAYKLQPKQIKELQDINSALSVEQATQIFIKHKKRAQSK